jgi:hypothetical protein
MKKLQKTIGKFGLSDQPWKPHGTKLTKSGWTMRKKSLVFTATNVICSQIWKLLGKKLENSKWTSLQCSLHLLL